MTTSSPICRLNGSIYSQVKKKSSETFHVYTVTNYETMKNVAKYTSIKDNLEIEALEVYHLLYNLIGIPCNRDFVVA